MLCKNPYVRGGKAFGCGQCLPCRFDKARIWTHRIMLEAYQHKENCFLTLTYKDDEKINLDPEDLKNFLKRLRKDVYPHKIRYYAVGEYGDIGGRPHYHLALFGFPTCTRGKTKPPRRAGDTRPWSCCPVCDRVSRVWNLGHVDLARIEPASARYIAGYVIKKMNRPDHPDLEGRFPEFARMSLRPGIGADAMHEVASVLMQHDYPDEKDVPSVLQHGRAKMPLGRYLRRQLRHLMGRKKDAPEITLKEMEASLQPLREIAKTYSRRGQTDFNFKQEIIEHNTGRRTNLEAKMKRLRKRGSI